MPTLHQSMLDTYEVQKEKADKIMFTVMLSNRNVMLERGRVFPAKKRKELGFNQSGTSDREDTNCEENIKSKLFNYLVSDKGNFIESVRDAYRWFGIIQAKIKCELGIEYEKMYASLPDERDNENYLLEGKDNIRIKELKAAYLAYRGWGKATGLDVRLGDLVTDFKEFIEEKKEYNDFIANCSNVDSLTTFGDFVNNLALDNDTIEDIYNEYKVDAGSSIYDAVKTRLFEDKKKVLGNSDIEVTDKEIQERVADMADRYMRASFEKQGRDAFLSNCTEREKKLYEEGVNLDKMNESEQGIGDWKADNNGGIMLLSAVSKTNLSHCLIEDRKRLVGGKEIGFYKLNGISELYNNDIENNRDYLETAIYYMEKTGKGKSKLGWHRNNSTAYEKMLNAVKEYKLMCDGRSGGKAMAAREEMVKCCLQYVTGKEKVRDTEFGKERFNMAMLVLSKSMKEKEFNALLSRINYKRSTHEGDDNYISIDTLRKLEEKKVGAYKLIEYQRDVRIQESTKNNRTIIPKKYEKVFGFIDSLYSRKLEEDYKELIDEEDINKFEVINDSFPAVESSNTGYKLSDKDFAAIAYAAALSPEALKYGGRFSDLTDEENVLYQGDSYTRDIMDIGSKASFTETDMDKIEFGRREAKLAMTDYGKGNKDRLARNLAYGLRHIIDRTKATFKLENDYIPDAEMGRRMSDMILRDAELKKMVVAYGVKAEEISYINSYSKVTDIYNKGVDKLDQLKKTIDEGSNINLSEKSKLDIAVDIISMYVVKECVRDVQSTLDENKEFVDKAKIIFADQLRKNHVDFYIGRKGEKPYDYYKSQAKRQALKDARDRNLIKNMADPVYLVKKLEISGQENKLKARVTDIVKKHNLHKLSLTELYDKIKYNTTAYEYTRVLMDKYYAQSKYKPEPKPVVKEVKVNTLNQHKTVSQDDLNKGRITNIIK